MKLLRQPGFLYISAIILRGKNVDFVSVLRLEEAQAGIKIAGRNINHLRYADDTTLMAESEEELKRLLMRVKVESENCWLKAQLSEN